MGRLIVVQFITLDGVVEDPDGSDGTSFGGWAMRYGPQGVAGDKFRLGSLLETAVLLFGRHTWDHFSMLWPNRTDSFSVAMNGAEKAVVTHDDLVLDRWANSHTVTGPLAPWVQRTLATRDVVLIGSGSVVDHLRDAGLVDEYRLITFPTAVGAGRRLFDKAVYLELVSSEPVGPAVLTTLVPDGTSIPRRSAAR